ncbi:MAG: hypothetical protein ACXVIY_00940 [Mucilaginibacter sp.]
MKTRDQHYAALVVGRKHTGKSTKLADIARSYDSQSKVLVLDVNSSPAYNAFRQIEVGQVKLLKRGVGRLQGTPTDETLEIIANNFRGGLVIFEDATKYILGNVKPNIRAFLTDHRMHRCDLIFTFHSLKMVPPFFWQMVSFLTLLKTQETLGSEYRNRIPNYEAIAAAHKRVNAHKDNYYSETIDTMI